MVVGDSQNKPLLFDMSPVKSHPYLTPDETGRMQKLTADDPAAIVSAYHRGDGVPAFAATVLHQPRTGVSDPSPYPGA